jgi:hypothetical protein
VRNWEYKPNSLRMTGVGCVYLGMRQWRKSGRRCCSERSRRGGGERREECGLGCLLDVREVTECERRDIRAG